MTNLTNPKTITITISGNCPHIGTTIVAGLIEKCLNNALAHDKVVPKVITTQRYEMDQSPKEVLENWEGNGSPSIAATTIVIKDDGVRK